MRLLGITLCLTACLLASCQSDPSHFSLAHESEPLLRVASGEPESLDPRLIRSTNAVTATRMFYEGLMRHNYRGQLVHGVARDVQISDDQKTWTFTLRDAHWSNGDPLTSDDFREAWLSTLALGFPAPNAYQLFVIKGAEQYKLGTTTKESVGLSTPDEKTLVIELTEPVPYFYELVASHHFYPVHRSMREGTLAVDEIVSNGPFQLEAWCYNSSIKASKNQHYWDKHEVKLDEVELVFVDDNTALNMFLADELDWVGSPNTTIPNDAVSTLQSRGILHQKPAAATAWFRVNTTRAPFDNKHFRQALSYAIDRQSIAEHLLQSKQLPAAGVVPSNWLDTPQSVDESYSPGKAWDLFQQALDEMDVDRDSLKPIAICFKSDERACKVAQAVQQQWEKQLGIKVTLEQCEGIAIFDKWTHLNYDIALGSWLADFKDPINFLEVFKTKDTPTNNTGWGDSVYESLLERSFLETHGTRNDTLTEAERLLIEEAPVIPIYHHTFLFAKKPNVHGVWLSEVGFLDFKYAFIDDANIDELESLD